MSNFSESFIPFESIYQTRVWGGRTLESRFGRELPDESSPFGEAWEISARAEADSVVASGSLRGSTLTELWSDKKLKLSIFGPLAPDEERFPLLCKILDARDKLSIQVHPPASVADELGGEPKTEVWFIAHAEPGAKLYVGLKRGVTSADFGAALEQGTAEDCVHAIPVETGEHIFIPSGRLHAIGADLVIYEIQQNSDTTYRVYDWNRMGMDGNPRTLHIEESLKCIDFEDVEPSMDEPLGNLLTECEHFRLEKHAVETASDLSAAIDNRFAILTVISGSLVKGEAKFVEGDFFLVPVGTNAEGLAPDGACEFLLTTWPS